MVYVNLQYALAKKKKLHCAISTLLVEKAVAISFFVDSNYVLIRHCESSFTSIWIIVDLSWCELFRCCCGTSFCVPLLGQELIDGSDWDICTELLDQQRQGFHGRNQVSLLAPAVHRFIRLCEFKLCTIQRITFSLSFYECVPCWPNNFLVFNLQMFSVMQQAGRYREQCL